MAKKGEKYTSPDGKQYVYTEGGKWREYVNGKATNNLLPGNSFTPNGGAAAGGGTGEQIAQTAFNTPDAVENKTPSSLSSQGQAYLAKSRAELNAQVGPSGISQAQADQEYARRAQEIASMSPAMQKTAWEVQSQVGPNGINQAQADQEIRQQAQRENQTQPNTSTNLTDKSTTSEIQNQIADSAKAYTQAETTLVNPNQVNDFGSSTVTIDPITGQPTVTQKLSDENKKVLGGIQGTSVNASDVAQGLLKDQYGNFVQGAGPQSGYNDPALQDSIYKNLTRDYADRFGREEEQLSQTLANRGIPVGSQAYTNAMNDFRRNRDDQYATAQNTAVQQGTATALTRQQNNVAALGALNQGVGTTAGVGQAGLYQPNFQGFQAGKYTQPDVQGLYNTQYAGQLTREGYDAQIEQQKIQAGATLGAAEIGAEASKANAQTAADSRPKTSAFNNGAPPGSR